MYVLPSKGYGWGSGQNACRCCAKGNIHTLCVAWAKVVGMVGAVSSEWSLVVTPELSPTRVLMPLFWIICVFVCMR